MAYLTWLGGAVQQAITQKRIGSPVALRAFFLLSSDHGLLLPTMAEALTAAARWFGSPLTRVYALGTVQAGEITALAEFAAGQTALVTAAVCGTRKKGSYYKDKYHRLRARRGRMRALMAIAHKILIAAFHLLAEGVPFRELGESFLDQQARQRTTRNLVRRLNSLGYEVLLRPAVAA